MQVLRLTMFEAAQGALAKLQISSDRFSLQLCLTLHRIRSFCSNSALLSVDLILAAPAKTAASPVQSVDPTRARKTDEN